MKKILLIVCVILQISRAFAAHTDTLTIVEKQSRYLTNKYFVELEDPKSVFKAGDIVHNHNFHPIVSTFPRLKYLKPVTWLKFTLKNKTEQPVLPITLSKSAIDDFDIYYEERVSNDHGNKIYNLKHLSSKETRYISPFLVQNLTLINLSLQPDSAVTLFARIKSYASTVIPIQVHSHDKFMQKRIVDNIVNGAVIGMFLIMALYNLMLFITVGDKSYAYYFIYIVFLGLTQALLLGFGTSLFADNIKILSIIITPVIRVAFGYSLLLFAGEFLQLKLKMAKYYWYYLLLYALYSLPLIAVIAGLTHLAYTFLTAAALTTSVCLIVIVIFLYTQGFKPAKFFMVGWGAFLMAILISIGRNNGLLPYNYLTMNISTCSAIIELIIFSVALADKINFYRYQNIESQLTALTIAKENERLITGQNILLENKVKERTQELIQTNQNLSITIHNLQSAQIQLVETEKMASLGQLTAGVAHEINNPINFVSSNVKPLRVDFNELFLLFNKFEEAANNPQNTALLDAANAYKDKIDASLIKDEISTLLDGIEEGAARTAEIVQSLRTFSRMDDMVIMPANINALILSSLVILRSSIPYYINIRPVLDKLEPLNCYSGKISQAIINLVSNGLQAIIAKEKHDDESIIIKTLDHDDHISIEITDTGIGISKDIEKRVFEPFFTTKPIGEGTGLGLSIVFGIIEKHNGTITVKSAPGKGATFIITLPKNLASDLKPLT